MGAAYRTGNEIVDRLGRLQITGNIIPAAWYRTIRRESGKPYLNAIVILSDIVYWYRPAEIRDEGTGQLLGYRKKFRADLLQRSYQQLADQFGISKRDASNAVIELEKLGVVKRVFRKLEVDGMVIPNVLFLALDVEVLERLTYPEDGMRGTGGDQMPSSESEEMQETEPVEKAVHGQIGQERSACCACHRQDGEVCAKQVGGITQIRDTPLQGWGDGVTRFRETNTEITYKDYAKTSPIVSYQGVKAAFKQQIEYDILKRDLVGTEELDELVEIASEVLTSTAPTIRVNREERGAPEVKERYRRLNMLHIQYVLTCLSEMREKARNIRSVMITSLYNAVSTISTYYGNLYQSHMALAG